jgi:hypothetical protein
MADLIHGATFTGVVPKTLYNFTLESFKITDTRSVHNDTDFVAVSVKVGSNAPITLPTKSMGDVNNGVHKVGLVVPNLDIPANTVVAFSYSIVNTGHDKDKVSQALEKVVSAAASKGASAGAAAVGSIVGGPVGGLITLVGTQAAGWVLEKLDDIIFANCDGTVAAADHVFTAAQIGQKTANEAIFRVEDDNKGSDSPWGCGGNSRYYVTWSVQSHN